MSKVVLHKIVDDADPRLVGHLLTSIESIIAEPDLSKDERGGYLRQTLEQYRDHTGRDGLEDIASMTRKSADGDMSARINEIFENGDLHPEVTAARRAALDGMFWRGHYENKRNQRDSRGFSGARPAKPDPKQVDETQKRDVSTAADFYQQIRRVAALQKRDNESVEQAVARMFTAKDEQGRNLRKSYQALKDYEAFKGE
jgi:hypothetical protein